MEGIPVNPSKSSLMPNGGVSLAVVAGAIGQFAAALLRDFNVWNMTAETQGSLTVITMAAILYVHHLLENRK